MANGVVAGVAIAGLLALAVAAVVLSDRLAEETTERGALAARLRTAEARLDAIEAQAGSVASRVAVLEPQVAKRAAADASAESERRELEAEPSRFIKCEGVKIVWRGLIHDYSRVTQATLRNASAYTVSAIRGDVMYRSATAPLGTVPATASGTILPGQAIVITVEATEITGRAAEDQTVFVVKSVSILGGR